MLRKLICIIKLKLGIEDKGVVIVDREVFAKEMMEKFKGNTELLKAIEKGMNKYSKKEEYVSLLD